VKGSEHEEATPAGAPSDDTAPTGPRFSEKAHSFGEGGVLFGIVSAPAQPRPGRPAVVLLNAGLVHRVGPFRLHVELARRLAARGFVTLRLDQSALGDSLPRPGGLSYEERAVVDAREAMTFLHERYGAEGFVLVGLCAGAMNAHRAAAADPRAVGLIALDGYAYRTPGYWRELLLSRLLDQQAWRARARQARQLIERALRRGEADAKGAEAEEHLPGEDAATIFAQDWPPLPQVRQELEGALGRGLRALFVYTGGWSSYVFAEQFDEMFPALRGRERVRVRYFPLADHTYVLVEHREAMLREVEAFLEQFATLERFPGWLRLPEGGAPLFEPEGRVWGAKKAVSTSPETALGTPSRRAPGGGQTVSSGFGLGLATEGGRASLSSSNPGASAWHWHPRYTRYMRLGPRRPGRLGPGGLLCLFEHVGSEGRRSLRKLRKLRNRLRILSKRCAT
jgi:dienelactone hydrolase